MMDNPPQVKKVRIVSLILAFLILVGVVVFVVTSSDFGEVGSNSLGTTGPQKEKSYEGRIVYIGLGFYPEDEIKYVLEGSSGEDIILLKAKDQKLEVSEGLQATVYGKLSKTMDGKKEVLLVERIVVSNAPN